MGEFKGNIYEYFGFGPRNEDTVVDIKVEAVEFLVIQNIRGWFVPEAAFY